MHNYFPRVHSEASISTIDEWLELPAPHFPRIEKSGGTGKVLRVKSIACVVVATQACVQYGIDALQVAEGKSVLPTFNAKVDGDYRWYRLPIDLSEWVVGCMATANMKRKYFPATVEFGEREGKTSAKFQ